MSITVIEPMKAATVVAGGEGFDWFYADAEDRAAQIRAPITDGAHGEPWVYRPKDLVGWWSNAHHDRTGGVRKAEPTAWVPGMKAIRLTEFGCAAVDRGGNAPNLFQDPKSAESGLPPGSTGARDDRMQRRALEAVLAHFAAPENNPVSGVYGGPMLEGADAWCWDARPYPAFPALGGVWADAGAWRAGHWLNGRLSGDGRDLAAAVLRRGGVPDDGFGVEAPLRSVEGIVVDRPMRTRDALEPLLAAMDLIPAEREGRIALIGRGEAATLDPAGFDIGDEGAGLVRTRMLERRPGAATVRFVDEGADYQTGSATVRSDGEGGTVQIDLPLTCGAAVARAVACETLSATPEETLTVGLGPVEALRVELGDVVRVGGLGGDWRVREIDVAERVEAVLVPLAAPEVGEAEIDWRPGEAPTTAGAPFLRVLDLPPLPGREEDARPLVAVAADPWRSMRVWAGGSVEALTERAVAVQSAGVGVLVEALAPGPVGRWDPTHGLVVRFEGATPESATDAAVFAGANVLAVETAEGWEIVQFRRVERIGEGLWRLDGLLRAQQGTEVEMRAGAGAGALVVVLYDRLVRAALAPAEIGAPLIWRAGPVGGPAGGDGVSEAVASLAGVQGRPFSPAHLRAQAEDGGVRLSWIARDRLRGELWEGEPAPSDPWRFRIAIEAGGETVRTFEVEGGSAL